MIFVKAAGLMAATTFGAGIFALPYVFFRAGWPLSTLYLVSISTVLILSHEFYWRVLKETDAQHSLLGLSKKYLGGFGFGVGVFAILGGLFFELVVYLILGAELLRLIFPFFAFSSSVLLFWFISSIPLLFSIRRFVGAEFFGGLVMVFMIGIMAFGLSFRTISFSSINTQDIFFPFGAILFALAGWTAVEPAYLWEKQNGTLREEHSARALGVGTWLTALLYFIFVIVITMSAAKITPDTFSGLTNWPFFKLLAIIVLGIFAIWTSYLPIGHEISDAFEEDLHISKNTNLAIVFFLPLFIVALGFSNFFSIIKLVGGVFLGLQYILILQVSRNALKNGAGARLLLNAMTFIFLLGVIYEFYYFIVD